MRHRNHDHDGFTLVELSIVLIIIGLISGGILVGKDLIHSAELRGTLTQLEQYKTAVNTFKIKYNCIPGDCTQTADYGFGAPGNGDGIVGEYCDIFGVGGSDPGDPLCPNYNANVYQSGLNFIPNEVVTFWSQLTTAGVLAITQYQNTYYPHPQTKMGHGSWVIEQSDIGQGTNSFKLVEEYNGNFPSAQASCGGETFCPSMSPADAYYFDQKIDDGLPFSGKIQAVNAFTYPGEWWQGGAALVSVGTPGPNNPVCVNNTVNPNQYNVQSVMANICMPEFATGF